MDASAFSTSVRLLCIRPSVKSSFSKLKAFNGITVSKFTEVMNTLLKRLSLDCFYHGNVNCKDVDEAVGVVCNSLTRHHVGLPRKTNPAKFVLKTKRTADQQQIVVPTIDHKDPNTAVEVYFQLGKDDNSSDAVRQRMLVDLLEQILEEPFYNRIRTKEQFGYIVSCGARWTYGVLGMSFQVVTACRSADETSSRIDDFLTSFRSELQSMDEQTFMEHLVALAKNKLEGYELLEEETSSYWSEIIECRYDYEAYRKEVQCLKTITKEQVVKACDDWLYSLCKEGKPAKRR
jgi:secreted Zn-dependent insulinase-like peptidase